LYLKARIVLARSLFFMHTRSMLLHSKQAFIRILSGRHHTVAASGLVLRKAASDNAVMTLSRRFASVHPAAGKMAPPTSDINDEPALIVMDQRTHLKNAALATALVCFCVGVATYSMNTVGQAGSGGPDDPLAALKQEAAVAQLKQQQESQQTDSTVDMLQKFQAGDYDPDIQEQLDLERSMDAKKKKAWWNFWSRS
jgi:hypothetical protein